MYSLVPYPFIINILCLFHQVQGVVEQRPVSSMLQSLNFRRHLENIIRGSISTARQSTTQARRTRADNSPRPSTPQPSISSSRSSSEATVNSVDSNQGINATPQPSVQRGRFLYNFYCRL